MCHPLHYGQESLRDVCILRSLSSHCTFTSVTEIALVTDFPRVMIITSAFSGDQKRRIDYVDTNPVRKLAKWGVTSVTSNQRKWLIEQCFDMFSVLPLFRMLTLSVPERLALFSFTFVPWFCSKLGMILLASFWPQQTKTSWGHFLMFCIPVISQSKKASPQKLTNHWFSLCSSLTDFPMIAGIVKITQHTWLWWFLRLLQSLNFDFHVIA